MAMSISRRTPPCTAPKAGGSVAARRGGKFVVLGVSGPQTHPDASRHLVLEELPLMLISRVSSAGDGSHDGSHDGSESPSERGIAASTDRARISLTSSSRPRRRHTAPLQGGGQGIPIS